MGPVAAVAIPAAIQAASSVGSAVAGGKGAKDAAKIQQQSYREGLAFERDKEATRRAQYAQAFQMWYASQQALRERYGLPALPPMEAFPASGGAAPAGAEPRMAMAKPGMAVAPRPAMAAEMPAGATLGDIIKRDPRAELEGWNDWSRMA